MLYFVFGSAHGLYVKDLDLLCVIGMKLRLFQLSDRYTVFCCQKSIIIWRGNNSILGRAYLRVSVPLWDPWARTLCNLD